MFEELGIVDRLIPSLGDFFDKTVEAREGCRFCDLQYLQEVTSVWELFPFLSKTEFAVKLC